MNQLTLFNNEEFGSIRAVEIGGEGYFYGNDVANVLGYVDLDKAVRVHVDEEDKKVLTYRLAIKTAEASIYADLRSGENDFSNKVLITESGVYDLIMNSKLPSAKKFKRWVTKEVLPSIRKTAKALETVNFSGSNGLSYIKNGRPCTTSRIIADVTGKSHNHVLRDIREELEILNNLTNPNLDSLTNPNLSPLIEDFTETIYYDKQNKARVEYELGELAAAQILMKYSSEFRAKFNLAFYEMRQNITNMFKARVVESVLPQDNRLRNFVYVLRNPYTDTVKIGVAQDVNKRIKQLETGAGVELELCYQSIVCSNAYNVEKLAHEHFGENRVFGEWYQVSVEEAIAFLEQQDYVLKSEFTKYLSIFKEEK